MKSEVKNPWLGLKSYPEGQKIYGRDKEIVELSQKILYNTQTVIYGKSGIGKSSILNAGVFPVLRRNNYFPVYVRLVHDGKVSYCSQIISAVRNSLEKLRIEDLGAPEGAIYKEVVGFDHEVVKRYDEKIPEGLWEFFHRHEFGYRLNEEADIQYIAPVLIFDQFEEIFTLQKDNEKIEDFFNELASLLNNICPEYLLQDTVEVSDREVATAPKGSLIKKGLVRKTARLDYIDETNMRLVISLREDYLSYLERNIMHIPSLKHNRYCLRPLSEDQAGDIIMKPVPGLIDVDVANAIICKVTGAKPDDFVVGDDKPQIEVDSAMLSLFLTELYEKKPLEQRCMTVDMVNSLGENIISGFYAKVTAHIPEKVVHFMEDNLLTEDGRRDNIPLSKAKAVISSETFEYLKEERFIHVFPWNNEMRIEYMHDILCKTIAKNREARLERIMMEKKEQEIRSMRRKNRITISSVVMLVMVIAIYYLCALVPVTQRYASTKKVYGQFKGVERLTKKEATYRPYHFVFKKKGLATKIYSSMECRNAYDTLSTDHSMTPYIIPGVLSEADLNANVASTLGTVCQWEFVTDIDGKKVIQERAYNDKYDLVYAFNYNTVTIPADGYENSGQNQTSDSNVKGERKEVKDVVIGSYVDDQGLPLEMLNDGYRFIRITYDDAGHDTLVEYFDWDGNPATNADGAYQIYYEYNEDGLMLSMSSLNKYGKRMIDKAGNCGLVNTYDGYRLVETLSVDEFGREKPVENGYSRVLYRYDNHGREVEMILLCNGEPLVSDEYFYRRETVYEDDAVKYLMYDAEDSLIRREYARHNEKGQKLVVESGNDESYSTYLFRYAGDGRTVYNKEITVEEGDTLGVYTFERVANTEERKFEGDMYLNYVNFTTYDSLGRMTEDVYYELDGVTPYEDNYRWHRITHVYGDNGRERSSIWREECDTAAYYNVDGLSHINVSVKYPGRNSEIYEKYGPDSTQVEYMTRRLDAYGNVYEDGPSNNRRAYYVINAKSHERSGEVIGMLTRYGFPTADFSYYKMGENGYDRYVCDENGEQIHQWPYDLPEVYSGNRNKTAVFIQVVADGRMFHGVLLESDSGLSYGDEDYNYDNFGQLDDVVYLNLTSMQIGKMSLATNDEFWSIYNCDITEEEYQIYQEHYLNYKLKDRKEVVYGTVEGDEGFLPENGHTGDFLILKWCDWDCTQSISAFVEELEKNEELAKDVVLLPFEESEDKTEFGQIIAFDDIEGKLGIHLDSSMISVNYFNSEILSRYNDYLD